MSSESNIPFEDISYIFLDRDGVINRKPPHGGFVTRWEEFELLPGVDEAIRKLNTSGRRVIVLTNQRGIALGLYSPQDLEHIHDQLRRLLSQHGARLDGIYVCPHEVGECNCRKPLTGLFEQAFQDFPDASAGNSVMVGDSARDIEAGVRVGMRTVFVTDHDAVSAESDRARQLADVCVASLAELVNRYLLGEYHR